MTNVGLIVPQSRFLPKLSREYREAFKAGLEPMSDEINLSLHVGGQLNSEAGLAKLIQTTILENDVDLIVCPLNPTSIYGLENLITSEEVPLIATTAGENLLPEPAESDFLFLNSFDLWNCGWRMGYEGTKRSGTRALLACSFQDGAYGYLAAVDMGIRAAGGEIVNSLVSRRRHDGSQPFIDIEKMTEAEVDVIYAFYSGDDAAEFLSEVQAHPELRNCAIYCNPFGFEHSSTAELSLHTVTTVPDAPNHPLPYNLLAEETAALICHTIEIAAHNNCGLREALTTARVSSIRGNIGLTQNSHTSQPGLGQYLVSKSKSQSTLSYELLDECKEGFDAAFELRESEDFRGWINPYLIA